jgi:galactokinase
VDYHLGDFRHLDEPRPIEEIHELIQASSKQDWTAYTAGGIYLLLKEYPDKVKTGVSIFIDSEVPIGKGVSSSAALEVASLKAIAAAYGLNLEGIDLATKCQWIENAICQSASGVMDQITVVLGEHDHFVPLVCQPCLPEALIRLPDPLFCWGIDSGVRHQVSGIEYEVARAATFMGYQMMCQQTGLELTFDETGALPRWVDPLWNGYLANLSPARFKAIYESGLPVSILGAEFSKHYPTHVDPFTSVRPNVSYPVRACTRYAVEENHRVHLFVDLLTHRQEPLSERTMSLLGELMHQSHLSYSECGLGSEATDLIVELIREEGPEYGLYGSKITGGGAGGTVAVLGKQGKNAEDAFQRVINRFHQATGYEPYIFKGSSPGADSFGVIELDPLDFMLV